MQTLLFADSHLDTHTWANRPKLLGDSMHSFAYIMKYALRHDIKDVIGAGDLIDSRKPSSVVVGFVRNWLDRLGKKNAALAFIQGQHELATGTPWMAAASNAGVHLHNTTMVLGKETYHFLDWQPADRLAEALKSIPKAATVLVCHQVWEEFMGDICSCEGSVTQIPHVTTVFTGDYHKCDVRRNLFGASGQELRVMSPGSTNLRAINEERTKGFYILEDGIWTRKRIPTRAVVESELADEDDLDSFIDGWEDELDVVYAKNTKRGLPEGMQTPLVWVKYREDIPGVAERVLARVGEEGHLFFKPLPHETEEVVVRRKQREKLAGQGLSSYLPLLVKKKDPSFKPVLRLLDADDPAAELASMRKERNLAGGD